MKCREPPSRGASTKTLTRLNLDCVSKDSCGINTFESETNRLIKSRLAGGNSMCLHDSIVYKNLKLATMVEQLQTFANCLDDTKWIFAESERLISELLVEVNDLREESVLKRLRIDSIGREYLKLKERFDKIDMGEIKRIVTSYMTDTASILRPLQDNEERKQRKPSLVVHTSSSVRHLASKEQHKSSDRLEQQVTVLKGKIAQLESSNLAQVQSAKQLEIKCSEYAQREKNLRREVAELISFANDKSQAEVSTVDRLKTVLKRLRDSDACSADRDMQLQLIDSYILNLSVLQRRLRQEVESRSLGSSPEVSELEARKQLLKSEVNALELESAHLREERKAVESYISKLQTNYEHRRRTEELENFNATAKSMQRTAKGSTNGGSADHQLYLMLAAQAETIEKLLAC